METAYCKQGKYTILGTAARIFCGSSVEQNSSYGWFVVIVFYIALVDRVRLVQRWFLVWQMAKLAVPYRKALSTLTPLVRRWTNTVETNTDRGWDTRVAYIARFSDRRWWQCTRLMSTHDHFRRQLRNENGYSTIFCKIGHKSPPSLVSCLGLNRFCLKTNPASRSERDA